MAVTEAGGETRTAIYRFYDTHRVLLYVGITNEPWRRWREHVLTQPWYPQARHWTVTWHDSEQAARRAELKAIRGERPRFNKADAPEPVPVRSTVHRQAAITACAAWASLSPLMAAVMVAARWYWLKWPVIVVSLDVPVPLALVCLFAFTAEFRRFAAWLDCHVTDGAASIGHERAGKVLALAREQSARVVQLDGRRQA